MTLASLSGQHALVTGASRGIGAVVAAALAAEGAHVSLLAREAQSLARLAGQLGNDRALPVAADVTDGASNSIMIGELLRFNNGGDCRGCWGKSHGASISAYTSGNPQVDGAKGIATPNVRAIGIYRDAPTHCANTPTVGDPDMECVDASGDGLGGNAMRSKHPGGAQAVFADGHIQFITNNIDKFTYRALMTIQGREANSNNQ